jgi:hypothetical protein
LNRFPVCLWFLAKNKAADAKRGFRDRRKQTLFFDARKLGTLIDRAHRELTDVFAKSRSARMKRPISPASISATAETGILAKTSRQRGGLLNCVGPSLVTSKNCHYN